MTIHIANICKQQDGRWAWRVKGLYGRNIYTQLETDERGRGLFVNAADALALRPLAWNEPTLSVKLIPEDLWWVYSEATEEIASRQLVDLLIHLGWGSLRVSLQDHDRVLEAQPSTGGYPRKSPRDGLIALYSAYTADLLLRVLERDIAPNWKVSQEDLSHLTGISSSILQQHKAWGSIGPLVVDQIERVSHAMNLYSVLVGFFRNKDIAGEWMHMPNSLSLLNGRSALQYLRDQEGSLEAWSLVRGLVERVCGGYFD